MTPAQKAAQTRRERKAKERERFRQMLADKAAIRAALMNVINNPDADPADVVRAAELLQNG